MLYDRKTLCIVGILGLLTLYSCASAKPDSASHADMAVTTTTEASSHHSAVMSESKFSSESDIPQHPQVMPSINLNRSNLANGGYVVETDTVRYYIDQDALHRMSRTDPDADASVLLYLPGIAQLNLYDDSTLFCTAATGIYRIDTNTGDTKLLRPLTLHTGVWLSLIIAKDTAYYTDGVTLWQSDLTFTAPSVCYRAEDGVIIDQLVWAEDRLCFSQYTQNAAFDPENDRSGVYCYDGTAVQRSYQGSVQALAVMDGQLYFCDTKQKAVMRMMADGSGQSAVYQGSYGFLCPSPFGFLAMNDAMQLVTLTNTDSAISFAEGYCPNLTADTLYYLHTETGMLCTMALSEIEAAASQSTIPPPQHP